MESLARWLGWPMLSHFSDSIMHVIYWRPVSSSPIIIRQQSSIITDHCKTITIFFESFWNQYGYKCQPFRYYHQGQTCQTTITITQSSVPTQEIGLTGFLTHSSVAVLWLRLWSLVHLVRTWSGSFCEQKHIQAAETDAWYIHVLHPNLTLVHLKLNLVQFKGHSGDERRSTKNAKASIGAIDPISPNDTSGTRSMVQLNHALLMYFWCTPDFDRITSWWRYLTLFVKMINWHLSGALYVAVLGAAGAVWVHLRLQCGCT